MRQTLVKEGIQSRLTELLGYNNNNYSIQSSMLEDMNRICSALASGCPNGRVMAGLKISLDSETNGVVVSSGYAITRAGKLIKISSTQKSEALGQNGTYNVYLEYYLIERGRDNGGYEVTMNRLNGNTKIIYDQFGADPSDLSHDVDNNKYIVTCTSGQVSTSDTTVYIGTITTNNGSLSVVYPQTANTYSDYIYSKEIRTSLASATNAFCTAFSSASEIVLPAGSNYVRSIGLLLRTKLTTAPRVTTTPANYEVRFSVRSQQAGSSLYASTTFNIGEPVSDYFYKQFDIGLKLDSNINSIYLQPSATAIDFQNGINATSPVDCTVNYIIEKLS